MQNCVRTDLALESNELYQESSGGKADGVIVERQDSEDAKLTKVKITNEQGAQALGKPVGTYITIELPPEDMRGENTDKEACRLFSEALREMISLQKNSLTLVAGLGNRSVTPDAIGPTVLSRVLVTRHLFSHIPEYLDDGLRPVCAVAPGVLGITGIETSEIIRGVADRVKPDCIIAIDALAARKMERVATTIQLADTGISPGSGVGNSRKELSRQTLGVPVIAVGVPTVVDAATIAADMLQNAGAELTDEAVQHILTPQYANIMVTPKAIDAIIERISAIIADGLNLALHDGLSLEDMAVYM